MLNGNGQTNGTVMVEFLSLTRTIHFIFHMILISNINFERMVLMKDGGADQMVAVR